MTYTRNSPWMIVVGTAEALRTYVPLGLAYAFSQSRLEEVPGTVVSVLFWCYSGMTVYWIVSRWLFRRFAFDAEGVRHRYGTFSRSTTFLPWSSVVAVEVHRDPIRNILGCCRVVLRASAGPEGEVSLDVVRCEVAEEIQRFTALPVTPAPRTEQTTTSSDPAGHDVDAPLFTASNGDLAIMSLAYGRFALFVPFAIGTYLEFAELVRLPDAESIVAHGLSRSPAAQLAWFGAFVAVALAYGYAVTALRFWRFQASVSEGSLLLVGGLLSSQRRTIPLDSVVGLALRRNAFELMTGRGRLALLTRDADQVLGKNVVLPALRMCDIEDRVESLGSGGREVLALDRAHVRAGRLWWMAGGRVVPTLLASGLALAVGNMWSYSAAAAPVVVLLCLVMVNTCFTLLTRSANGDGLLYRRGVMWRSSFSLPLQEVRVLKSISRPWYRWMGLRQMSLYYFSGGTRRLVAWLPSDVAVTTAPGDARR